MKLAIVILNWNGRAYLEQFLPILLQHNEPYAEIVVADNASTDDSVEYLQQNFPQIRIVQNDQNYGFAQGYNEALKQIDAEYYCLLNSDIEVCENWIQPVISLMDSNPDVAICQPKLLSYYDRNKFEYAGAAGGYIDGYGYPFCRGRIFETVEEDKGQYNDVHEIFWATGACMFVRAELYHKYGGLDNDFFAHMEEIDFCWRIKRAGYKVMYCPDAKVYHIGGGTLPKHSPRKTYLNYRNNIMLLHKNMPKPRLYWVLLLRIGLDIVASIRFLLDSGWGDFAAVFRAYGYIISHLRKISRKRHRSIETRTGKQVNVQQVPDQYKNLIVLDYYLRGKKRFSQLKTTHFFSHQ